MDLGSVVVRMFARQSFEIIPAAALRFRPLPCSPPTMFYVIGLGLCDEKDITVRGLEVGAQSTETHSVTDWVNKAVKSCSRVYLEVYTSILMVEKSRLVCIALDMHLQCLTVRKVGGVL